jgi:hypothetical protein
MNDESETAIVIARDVLPDLIKVLQTLPPEDRRKAVEASMLLLEGWPSHTAAGLQNE